MSDKRGIGVFSSYDSAESALIQLKSAGLGMERVSLIGRDVERQVEVTGAKTSEALTDIGDEAARNRTAGEAAKNGAIAGTAFGGVAGLLVGLGALALPGVGPVMLAGAAATTLAATASGSAIGATAGSLAGGLVGLNVPDEQASMYSDRVAQGNYLVMIEGSANDLNKAESIFTKAGIQAWTLQDIADHHDRNVSPASTN
jgi:hypothetical protein